LLLTLTSERVADGIITSEEGGNTNDGVSSYTFASLALVVIGAAVAVIAFCSI